MDQVFAPWRIEWVERDDKNADVDDCVFCEFPERGADREHRVVARSEHTIVMLNNYPYNPGHLMVIPRVHEGDYDALPSDVIADHAHMKQRAFRALRAAFDPDGFNAGLNLGGTAAGGSISDHLHTRPALDRGHELQSSRTRRSSSKHSTTPTTDSTTRSATSTVPSSRTKRPQFDSRCR